MSIYDERQLTLGQLIQRLEQIDPRIPIRFSFGNFGVGGLDSYRGFYKDLAIAYDEDYNVTVGKLLEDLRLALRQTFYGYKGGECYMHNDTPLWVANYGEVTSTAVCGVAVHKYAAFIDTCKVDL